jgi:shikimate kinase
MMLKLKRTPGVYIVGFMGCGKTTVGRLLADHIGWRFVDLDEEIEAGERRTVANIFDEAGEAEFRRIEHQMIRRHVRAVECGKPMVIALGGGTFVQPDNFALLANNGVTVWLDCPLDIIEKRVGNTSHRPLARDPEHLRNLYEKRRQDYARADFRVEIRSEDPQVNLAAIMALSIFH